MYRFGVAVETNTISSKLVRRQSIYYRREKFSTFVYHHFHSFIHPSTNPTLGINLLVQSKVSLVISPPADLRSTLLLGPTDIRGRFEFVSNVTSRKDAGSSTDSNDRVGGDILEPDGLAFDGVDDLLGVLSLGDTDDGERKNENNDGL